MQLHITPFQEPDRHAVVSLWRRCGLVTPQNDPDHDIDTKTRYQPELFFVGSMDGRVVATAMAGYEGHRGWINYLAVAPEHQRRGVGRLMLEGAETALRELGCVKVNLHVRTNNLDVVGFYEAMGYAQDQVITMSKRLYTEARATS